MLVFPEGTTLNGRALISFKPGAFAPQAKVQPAVARFPLSVRCGMGLDPPGAPRAAVRRAFLRMMLQPWNRVRIDFLDPIEPLEESTSAFGGRVRQAMADALRRPGHGPLLGGHVAEHDGAPAWVASPQDARAAQSSAESFARDAGGATQSGRRVETCADADQKKHGKLSVVQFRAALRGDVVEQQEDLRLDDSTLDALFGPSSALCGNQILDAPSTRRCPRGCICSARARRWLGGHRLLLRSSMASRSARAHATNKARGRCAGLGAIIYAGRRRRREGSLRFCRVDVALQLRPEASVRDDTSRDSAGGDATTLLGRG